MRYGKIMWGIILIIFGIMLVLKNMGFAYFNWHSFFNLWPLLFIFWGISILPIKEYIKLILGIITLIVAVILFNREDGNFSWGSKDKENLVTNEMDEQTLIEAYNPDITMATLKLNAAAGNFKINETTDELIYFNKKGNIGNYNMGLEKKGDSTTVVRIESDNNNIHINNNKGSNVHIKLNPNPIWDMEFDIGAANTEFDLSEYKTKSIEINGGAASINLKVGDKFYRTKLDISTGASSININIPKTSGCEVQSETFLVDKQIKGFNKDEEGNYRTENFKYSSNKIYITLDAAISSFKITRY
jgi:hypothetical protein